jgi:hypothetical protein
MRLKLVFACGFSVFFALNTVQLPERFFAPFVNQPYAWAGSPPAISSFSPTSGGPGTQVTINGSNFDELENINFNGAYAAYIWVSSTQLKATVPSGATTGKIQVKTSAGSASSASQFTVPGVISSFSPASGPVGTSVTINGTGFSNSVSSVKFGNGYVSFVRESASKIEALINTSATTGKITVNNGGTSLSSSGTFTVTTLQPRVDSFSPTNGPPGTKVVIKGANFINVTSVKIGSIYLAFTVDSETQITATTKTGNVSGKITLTTLENGSASSSGSFTSDPPKLTSFSPTSGSAYPVTTVTINGLNLVGINGVSFDGAPTSYRIFSDKKLEAEVPCPARTGKISVKTFAGTIYSTANFGVQDAGVPEDVPTPIACLVTPTTPPSGFNAATYWAVALVDTAKSGTGSVEVAYTQLWCTIDGVDTKLADDVGTLFGGLFSRDTWDGAPVSTPMPWTYNPTNNSAIVYPSENPDLFYHWYMPTPRASWPTDASVTGCRVKTRVKISGSALLQMGGDWWLSSTAAWNGEQVNNRAMGNTNWYFPNGEWQDITFP